MIKWKIYAFPYSKPRNQPQNNIAANPAIAAKIKFKKSNIKGRIKNINTLKAAGKK